MENESEIKFYFGIISTMLAFVILAVGFVLVFIRYQKGIFRKQQELFRLDAQHKQDLLLSSIESAEAERMRIAKDIHDELGSIFSTLSLSINRLNQENVLHREHFHSSQRLVESGISSVRRISHAIVPFELELLGLQQTLENYFETLGTISEITINFNATYPLQQLNSNASLAVYRIFQELCSNCMKYAGAKNIEIDIHVINDRDIISILYKDDGIGVNPEELVFKKGIGLKNIESRAILMNGSVRFDSAHGKGFACEVLIPLTKNTRV